MSQTADNDRAAARCDGSGNIYTATICPEGEIDPVGIPTCRGCGGTEFTVFGERDGEPTQVDE